MSIIDYFKNNRIKLLKYLITLVVLFFLLTLVIEILKVLFDDVYNTITLTYIVLIVMINYIPEFSPYILNNYLIYLFPFLSNYFGRGTVYIIIGLATISPELNNLLNLGGYALIITGLLCIYMNWLISKNLKSSYYPVGNNHDINEDEKNEILNFPNDNKNDIDRNSKNSDTNEKNGNLDNNMLTYQEANNAQDENQNNKMVEMKKLDD